MNEAVLGARGILRQLLRPPDALMLELGAGGELLVARVRAGLSLLLLALPLFHALDGGSRWETFAGLFGVSLTIAISLVWLALARRTQRYPWLSWASATYDVSLTSAVLLLLAANDPAAALNSMVVWVFYLFAIVLTALRNDSRVTLYAGALALAQYGLMALVLFTSTPAERLVSLEYGIATASTVTQRLVLMTIMTTITTVLVLRMQRLVESSGKDGLTGLPNRSWLLHRFPHLLDAARAEGGSLSVCLVDLDRFKALNHEWGHRAGDRALLHLAQVLRAHANQTMRIARLGGGEFVLVMTLPIGRSWELAELMRRELAASRFQPEADSGPVPLSFSAGLAAWPQDGIDLSTLLRRADARLRRAKAEGRNRVLARDD